MIQKLLRINRPTAYYYFARVWDGASTHGESGVHKHIKGIKIGKAQKMHKDLVYPMSAELEIDLDALDRLRRTGVRGKTPFPEYTKLEE